MKYKENHVASFATFVSKTLIFSVPKIDEFNFKPAQYCINKIFELTKSCIWAISNGYKKVVIEPCVVQFLSEVRT